MLATLSPSLPAAAAGEKRAPRVGVVVTVRVNIGVDEADVLADRLGDALHDKLVVDVIAGSEATRRLGDLEVPEDCVAQPACVTRVAGRLDADQMLFLVVVRVAGTFQIDPTWTDATGSRVVARDRIVLEESDTLHERVFRGAAPRLLPDAEERKTQVIIGNGGPTAPAPPRGRHMTTGAWVAAGVAGGAFLGGAIFGGLAWNTSSQLEEDGCDVTFCEQDRVDSLETQMLAADALFGVSILAGATAAYLWYTSADPAPRATPGTDVGVVPTAGGGVMVQSVTRF